MTDRLHHLQGNRLPKLPMDWKANFGATVRTRALRDGSPTFYRRATSLSERGREYLQLHNFLQTSLSCCTVFSSWATIRHRSALLFTSVPCSFLNSSKISDKANHFGFISGFMSALQQKSINNIDFRYVLCLFEKNNIFEGSKYKLN